MAIPTVRETLIHPDHGELPARRYDVQVEGVPPGDYVHTDELDLGELLALIERFRSGEEHWP